MFFQDAGTHPTNLISSFDNVSAVEVPSRVTGDRSKGVGDNDGKSQEVKENVEQSETTSTSTFPQVN